MISAGAGRPWSEVPRRELLRSVLSTFTQVMTGRASGSSRPLRGAAGVSPTFTALQAGRYPAPSSGLNRPLIRPV